MRIPSVEGWVLYDGDCAFCIGWLHFCTLVYVVEVSKSMRSRPSGSQIRWAWRRTKSYTT